VPPHTLTTHTLGVVRGLFIHVLRTSARIACVIFSTRAVAAWMFVGAFSIMAFSLPITLLAGRRSWVEFDRGVQRKAVLFELPFDSHFRDTRDPCKVSGEPVDSGPGLHS
jgi:hypothetical protein